MTVVPAVIDLIRNSNPTNPPTGELVNLAISQGADYAFPVTYEGDLTAGQWRGEIRRNYLAQDVDENGVTNPPLAVFTFAVAYDSINDVTNIVLLLSNTVTNSLPATLNVPDTRRSAVNQGYYVYDVEYEESNIVDRKQQGLVEITPQTTED